MSPLGHALLTTFGLGHLRPASGTWGSLPPALLAAVLVLTGHSHSWLWWAAFSAIAVVFALACILFGDAAEAKWFKKDPGHVVADETCGMALTLLPLPLLALRSTLGQLGMVLAAFLLFRVLDIIKPPPAHGLQRFGGGWGILLDDLAAGLYGAGLMLLLTPLVLAPA
ncbi:MAG: phosphatidylglycerophosphatase A [Phycisphaerales bacterium]